MPNLTANKEILINQSVDSLLYTKEEGAVDSVNIFSDSLYVVDSMMIGQRVDSISEQRVQKRMFTTFLEKKGSDLPIILSGSDGLFALVLTCFLLLSFSYREILAFMKENILLAFSTSKSEKLYDKTITMKERFNLSLLVFSFILVLSISFYIGFNRLWETAKDENQLLVTLGLFIIALSAFVLLKLGVNKLIGYVFDIKKGTNIWNLSYLILLGLLGGSCFIPVLLLVYSKVEIDIIIVFMLMSFLIVQVSLMIRMIMFFRSQKFSILFLIAYLCTVEIIPYFFLGIGMAYLYKVDIF